MSNSKRRSTGCLFMLILFFLTLIGLALEGGIIVLLVYLHSLSKTIFWIGVILSLPLAFLIYKYFTKYLPNAINQKFKRQRIEHMVKELRQQAEENTLIFFEVPRPDGDGLCSDNKCPCPETPIPLGTGYIYISDDVVDYRRDCPTVAEMKKKIKEEEEQLSMKSLMTTAQLKSSMSSALSALPKSFLSPAQLKSLKRSQLLISISAHTAILMCEQCARLRMLDMDIAATDAKYWWETGWVPLRATPIKKRGCLNTPIFG